MPRILNSKDDTDGTIAEVADNGDAETVTEIVTAKLNEILASEDKVLPGWKSRQYVSATISSVLNSENDKINCKIAVVAPVSAGKSTLLNAICEYPILPAASGITSSVPTYITRADSQDSESISVYPLLKKVTTVNGSSTTSFQRDEQKKRTYKAADISEDLFNELFEYVFYIMRGNGQEYATTIENIAYFMNSVDAVDIEFNGKNAQKMSLDKADFALSYREPRHRLLLLLVLLCLYVNQNEDNSSISQYKKKINEKRRELLYKCGLPVDEDYCVLLDWRSSSIPEGVTLIDLPGTGADTKDINNQSSHTTLVKGILYDADAIWVLASDNGTVQSDLLYAIKDAIEMDTKKNKVCIYNCKNKHPNDSTPVSDFIAKLPFLIGERCYVVNALAGEYKYTQNGINASHTKTASDIRKDPRSRRTVVDSDYLWGDYGDIEIGACPTYITHKEEQAIVVTQEEDIYYTLETFFKSALTEYVTRLKYEVSLRNAIKQADFFGLIKNDLESTLKLLEGISGKGQDITEAVSAALERSYEEVKENYVNITVQHQTSLNASLDGLHKEIGAEISKSFGEDYSSLIADIHAEWRKLITDGTEYSMTTNWLGNYPLGSSHDNWKKFCDVCDNVDAMISINAFASASKVAEEGIQGYKDKLSAYISALKGATDDFRNDYINAFSVEYDRQRNLVCFDADGNCRNRELARNFDVTKDQLMSAIRSKMDGLYKELCICFDTLLAADGLFENLVADTTKEFKKQLSDNVLDGLRADLRSKFIKTDQVRLFSDHLDVSKFNAILLSDFTNEEEMCKEKLGRIVLGIYGGNLSDDKSTLNFYRDIFLLVTLFNSNVISGPSGVTFKIENIHENLINLIGFGANMATDVTSQIDEVRDAISKWSQIGLGFFEIKKHLIISGTENVVKLYESYQDILDTLDGRGVTVLSQGGINL